MSTIVLPIDGQTAWGDELNAAVTTVNTTASSAQTTITNHAANSPADPHGDRSYALSLFSPITTGANLPNGFVQLNGNGTIPANLISGSGSAGGMFNGIFDAKATYGAVPGSSDSSAQIQAALNAAGSSNGGIVWIGPGNFSLANYLVVPSNTWLLLSEGTTLTRIPGSLTPAYIITNILFGSNNTPSTNIRISGGSLDAVGSRGLSNTCTPVFIIQSSKTEIHGTNINNVFNNPAIELNGCSNALVDFVSFTGTGSSFAQPGVPAVRLGISNSSTTPSGLAGTYYNNSVCTGVSVTNCKAPFNSLANPPYGAFAGTDLVPSGNFKNTDIFLSNCFTANNAFNSQPLLTSAWSLWSQINCIWNDFSSTDDGWHSMVMQNSWANSGQGPTAQYRYLEGIPNTIEIIGDVLTGAQANNTVIAQLPFTFNTPQTIDAILPGNSSGYTGRIVVQSTGQVECFGLNSGGISSGSRMTFHGFVSFTA